MELSPTQRDKLDPKLLEVLWVAGPADTMKVVFILKVENADFRTQPDVSKFSDRIEWRKAVTEWRKKDLEAQVGGTIQMMRDFDLSVNGGALQRMVVVEGSAENIVKALSLEKVQKVIYDHQLPPLPDPSLE